MDQDTLEKLHNVMLEIMDEFVRICEENNLTYFLGGGTLLGAVRHKGFIPWDDDVDIVMPRNDYEKFLDICEKSIGKNFYALSHRCPVNTFYHYKPFAKFCKKDTVFAESHIHDPKNYSGIWIDIWPFDNCVELFLPLQTIFISFVWKMYRLKTHEDISKVWIKRSIGKLLCCFFSLQIIKKLKKESYSFFNRFKTKHITCFSGIYGYKRETKKRDTIFPLGKLTFEGKEYYVPGNYDAYLKRHYGDYMKLPPLEQQKGHMPNYILFGDE
jgi:lipopolysaccharide cholinephosphotransferase